MNFQMKVANIMRDPAASDWLKVAITALSRRDPVDAVDDVAILGEICEARLNEVQWDAVYAHDRRRGLSLLP